MSKKIQTKDLKDVNGGNIVGYSEEVSYKCIDCGTTFKAGKDCTECPECKSKNILKCSCVKPITF